jgi:hypothetical protein
MPHIMKVSTLSLLTLIVFGCQDLAGDNPYGDDQAVELVARMVEAHGGDLWTSAPSIHFTITMYLASLPVGEDGRTYEHNWRVYKVTQNPTNGQGYVELPWEDREGPSMAFNGEELWALDYHFDPVYNDDPFTLLYYHYSMLGMPWSAQLPGVELEYAGLETSLPGYPKEHHVVKMTFNPVGKKHEGYIKLFIDPETYLLRGFEHTSQMTMLPGDVLPSEIGLTPVVMYRVTDGYLEVDGVTVPKSYTTFMLQEDGSQKMVGVHMVTEPSLTRTISADELRKPDGATVIYGKDS